MGSTASGPSPLRRVLDPLRAATAGAPGPWAVAYSGGRDSAVLLWAATRVLGPGVTALYVDHGWRPAAEREAERRCVEAWAAACGAHLVASDPPAETEATEAAARRHRHRCFQTWLRQHDQGRLLLAHHAGDQAETVLMRLFRGRSWAGLGAMAPVSGALVRPWLAVDPRDLAAVAAAEAVVWHEDSTNTDRSYLRNWLRAEVLPLLGSRFPRAPKALVEFAELWRRRAPAGGVEAAWHRLGEGPGGRLRAEIWDAWDPWRRQDQLLALAAEVDGAEGLARRFLEAACRDGRAGRVVGRRWQWRRRGGWVWWEPVAPAPGKEYFMEAVRGFRFDAGSYVWTWTEEAHHHLALTSVDPDRPWQWRSPAPGYPWRGEGGIPWTRDQRRRRLDTLDPARRALVTQDGEVRAVVDPTAARVLWTEPAKLNKPPIFVRLEGRSSYERR